MRFAIDKTPYSDDIFLFQAVSNCILAKKSKMPIMIHHDNLVENEWNSNSDDLPGQCKLQLFSCLLFNILPRTSRFSHGQMRTEMFKKLKHS